MVVAAMLVLAVAGCGGPGQTLPMSVTAYSMPTTTKTRHVRIAVLPFEDVRVDKSAIGRWQHYAGATVDQLIPAQGSAADQLTEFVADYLKLVGFEVIRAQPGVRQTSGLADVVLSGRIEAYWSEAVTRFARTELTASNRLAIDLSNAADGSTVRTTVGGAGASTAIFFDLADLERLNNAALAESLDRFLAEVVVKGRALKPKG
jgi:hypothetical protein